MSEIIEQIETVDWKTIGSATNRKADGATGLTIGAFDGVHLGHQALIHQLVSDAHAAGMRAVAVTFDPLPLQLFSQQKHELLSDLDERLALLLRLGVDGVAVLNFDQALAALPADDFVRALLQRFDLRRLWVGPDFALGRNREGDVAYLQERGARHGFSVHVFDRLVLWEGQPVRSSRIRRALKAGRLREANGCLGRPYRLAGIVGHGDKRGRLLGFPTANLELPEDRLRPANGVYVCRAHLADGTFDAITNVGTRPTFNNRPPTVEAHLLDFSADIYEAPMQLAFLHRLRPELKFSSADALIAQMQRDEGQARAWLRAHSPAPE